jgi:PAS domain S-box-containing protein
MLTLIKQSYFQVFVESISNGVLILNTRGVVYVANGAAANTLGIPKEDCLDRDWHELFEGVQDNEQFEIYMQESRKDDRCILPFHTTYKRPDGTILHLTFTTSLLIEYGKIFGILVLITDVTSIYAMMDREKQILQEINIVQRERLSAMDNLSTAIAHQIRNPMMTIGGFARILLRKLDDDNPMSEYLEGIVEAATRLETIVQSVGEYTKLVPQEAEQVSIEHVFEEAKQSIEELAEERSRSLTWEVDLEPLSIKADSRLLWRALYEILLNSLESVENGPVSVQVEGVVFDGHYRLTIADDGDGISERDMPFIFDPFFTTKPLSVGMGLSRAQKIIQEYKGQISVDSSPGEGAKVVIEMPLTNSPI